MSTTLKRRWHTPEQIVRKVREGKRLLNEGKDLTEVLRQLEVTESTWGRWRAQYGGMKASEVKRLRELEVENTRLKKLLAEAELDKAMLEELEELAAGEQPPTLAARAPAEVRAGRCLAARSSRIFAHGEEEVADGALRPSSECC